MRERIRGALALLVIIALLAIPVACKKEPAELIAGSYNTLVYLETGGAKLVGASGAEIELQSGSTLDVQSGATYDIDAVAQFDNTVTVGVSGTGHNVVFHSDTATEEFTWDATNEKLVLDGVNATNVLEVSDGDVSIVDDLTVTTGSLDVTAGATTLEALSVGVAGTGADVYFYSDTDGDHLFWDESDEILNIIGTAGQNALNVSDGNVSITDNLNVDGTSDFQGNLTDSDSALTTADEFMVDGAANAVQAIIQGHTTQTSATFVVEDSGGTDIFSVFEAAVAGSGGFLVGLVETFTIMNGTDVSIGLDMDLTGANATGTGNKLYGIDLSLTTPDAQVTEVGIIVNDADWDYAIDAGDIPAILTAQTWFLDFLGDTVPAEIVEVSGTDAEAVQAIQTNTQYGIYQVTSGDTGVNCAGDCEGFSGGTAWSADQGSLVFEARLHIDTAITNGIVCVGLTDTAALEMPATIGGGDAVTRVADDALCFCFDAAADTDEWFAIGFDNTVASTGVGVAVGVAPVADTDQVFRIEVDGGEDARFYIDGTEVDTVTANAITVTDLLAPFCMVSNNAAASTIVDVDYVYCAAQRQ